MNWHLKRTLSKCLSSDRIPWLQVLYKISVVIKQCVLVTRNSSVGPGFWGLIGASERWFSCVSTRKVYRKFGGMLKYYGF